MRDETTHLTNDHGELLAHAILHLSKALEVSIGPGPRIEAARALAQPVAYPRDVAFPPRDASVPTAAPEEAAAAERVMVRAVAPGHPGPDDDGYTWTLDPSATGHRAPFAVGDLVVRSSGRAGIHQVVAVSTDEDAPSHRSLRLRVEPTDVVVDRDAF